MDTKMTIQGGERQYTIQNLLTDPHVIYNENNLPYATSIQLSMPLTEEITPVETDAIIYTNTAVATPEQRRVHFSSFDSFTPGSNQPLELFLKYGDKLAILEDTTSTNINQGVNGKAITIIDNDILTKKDMTSEANTVELGVRIYKACKYFIINHLTNPQQIDKDIFWLQNKASEWQNIIGIGKILASAALALVGAREDADDDSQMEEDYVQDFYYNGTVAFAPIEIDVSTEEPVTPFEPVIAEATIADQINGNIFSNDLIQFYFSNNNA